MWYIPVGETHEYSFILFSTLLHKTPIAGAVRGVIIAYMSLGWYNMTLSAIS